MHSFSFFLTLSQSRLTVGEAAAAAAHQLHVISNKISAPTKEEEEEKRRVQGSSRVLSTVCGTRLFFLTTAAGGGGGGHANQQNPIGGQRLETTTSHNVSLIYGSVDVVYFTVERHRRKGKEQNMYIRSERVPNSTSKPGNGNGGDAHNISR